VRFCIDSGADGLVTPANASEAPYLTDRERQQVVSTVVDETSRKIPVVIGVTSSCGVIARGPAREAEAAGADALIAMPPQVQRASEPEIKAYYAAIAEASDLPLFLQNYGRPGGTPMSARLMAELVRSLPSGQGGDRGLRARDVRRDRGGRPAAARGHGREAGRHLLDEYRRGVCGTMPACEVVDVHEALWRALEAGDMQKAGDVYRRLLPLLTFEMAYGPAVYKEVLRRRGVIRSAAFRQTGGRQLDPLAMEELTQILDDLGPLLSRRYRADAGALVA
jgi:4-hydroxy-tetrahydrodipicolinate synthase